MFGIPRSHFFLIATPLPISITRARMFALYYRLLDVRREFRRKKLEGFLAVHIHSDIAEIF